MLITICVFKNLVDRCGGHPRFPFPNFARGSGVRPETVHQLLLVIPFASRSLAFLGRGSGTKRKHSLGCFVDKTGEREETRRVALLAALGRPQQPTQQRQQQTTTIPGEFELIGFMQVHIDISHCTRTLMRLRTSGSGGPI